LCSCLGAHAEIAGSEQALKNHSRVQLRRHRSSIAAPRNAVSVRTAISRVAVADCSRVFAAQLNRGESRRLSKLLRRNLIGRNSVVDVRTFGLSTMDSSQKRRTSSCVIPRAVPERIPVVLGEACEHEQVLAKRFKRLEDSGELVRFAFGGWCPVLHHDAVWYVHERESHWGSHRGRPRQRRSHRIKHREAYGYPEPFQECSTRHMFVRDDHDFPGLRI